MGKKLARTYNLELPYPPSINHYWRRAGRPYISQGGRQYREAVAEIVARQGFETIAGPVSVAVHLYTPDRRRRDVDNVLKPLLDALEYGGAFWDDHQVARLSIVRLGVVEGGRTLVTIREVGER